MSDDHNKIVLLLPDLFSKFDYFHLISYESRKEGNSIDGIA